MFKYGQMGHGMRVIGVIIEQMAGDDLFMQMGISMRVNGLKIKLMVLGNIST